MPTSERLVLDPSEIVTTRTSMDITAWIDQEGADWGEATIEPFLADKDRGSIPVDYRLPNREITIPLTFSGTKGGTTTVAARAAIQAKAALFQKEGGWLKRLTNSGGTVYADIVDASFAAASVAGYESKQDIDLDAHLTLTCLPDFYEQERTLGDHVETSNPELVFTETNVSGDYPARVRIKVDDDQGQDQRGLIWGLRSRYYDSAATAALRYNAEALDPLGGGTVVATTGASGGTAVRLSPLWPSWSPVLGTNKGGTAYLTHKGTYRFYARVYIRGTVETQARLRWDVGDLVNPVTNDAWTIPSPGAGTTVGSAFYTGDLGEVRLDASPVGTHRWQGQIDAQTYNVTSGTADFRVDRVWMVPVDEGMGVLTAPQVAPALTNSLVGFDSFTYGAGSALGGQTAPLGGNWDAAGDAIDFKTYGSASVVGTALGDASLYTGRYAMLDGSSSLDAVEVKVDLELPRQVAGDPYVFRGGVLARYVSTNSWLMGVMEHDAHNTYVRIIKRVGGTATELAAAQYGSGQVTGWHSLKLLVDEDGKADLYLTGQGGNYGAALASASDAALATGGTLDNGKVGIYDVTDVPGGTGGSRYYDNFVALAGAGGIGSDAVTFASQSTQLTTDGHYRLDSGGTAYGPVSIQSGDLPRLPVAGLENRTTQIFLKASRGDFDSLPDSGIDDISAQISYSPSWLVVPDS